MLGKCPSRVPVSFDLTPGVLEERATPQDLQLTHLTLLSFLDPFLISLDTSRPCQRARTSESCGVLLQTLASLTTLC